MMKRLFFSLALAGALGLTSGGVVLAAPGPGMGHGGGGHAFAGHAYGPRGVPYYRGYRGFGFGYVPWGYGPGWGWGYYGYAPYVVPSGVVTGGLRLEIEPKTAGVFVDGAYAGVVDDFNGHFQHLDLIPGAHRIEVRQPGFQPLTIQPYIQPDHTTDYKATLTPESQSPRPALQ
jgi:hypothetical protein